MDEEKYWKVLVLKTVHVIPLNDIHDHEETLRCDCGPKVIHEGDDIIINHRAYDCREAVESAEDILEDF